MDKFVVGFAYTRNNEHGAYQVLLMKKNRPEWQKDCLNGIGGKIEPGETPILAIHRESMEEAGLRLNWLHRGVMQGTNNDGKAFECHIFYAYDNAVINFKQIEDEKLGLFSPSDLWRHKLIDNLKFLIPYGLSNDHRPFMTLTY